MTEHERLKILRESYHLKQDDFGKPIGLSGKTISAMEKGTNNISSQTKLLLEKIYRVSIPWLESGEGNMIKPVGHVPTVITLVDKLLDADAEDIELIRYILEKENPKVIHVMQEMMKTFRQ